MLVEQAAYESRWRTVTPGAKILFSACGMVAAFLAPFPAAALGVATLFWLLACLGAGVAWGLYLRIAAPALGFLALSCLPLFISLEMSDQEGLLVTFSSQAENQVLSLASRSLAALTALLFMVLTTQLTDLIACLRRVGIPGTLLDLMIVCYRMLFVFSKALQDMRTAQQARLGYTTSGNALRSLSLLVAELAAQIWQRAQGMHRAALSRNGEGGLRFLARTYPDARRHLGLSMVGGTLLLIGVWGLRP